MTPILADAVPHRARFAWLAGALCATAAAASIVVASAPARSEPQELRFHRCAKWNAREPSPSGARDGLLPPTCVVYQARMLRLSECSQLPAESRRALRDAWAQTATSWSGLSGEAQRALRDGCRMATDALEETAAAISCDITGVNRHWPSFLANDSTFNP